MFKKHPKQSAPAVPTEQLRYDAPPTLAQGKAVDACLEALSPPVAAYTHPLPPLPPLHPETCTICLDSIKHNGKRIKHCQHGFHESCLSSSLQHCLKCPVCRKPIGGEPEGRCPSGTLKIYLTRSTVPGFDQGQGACKAIEMDYNIPSGIQSAYHDAPGYPFTGAERTAYLPDNKQGRQLLHRLKYAFTKGLTFTIGTSLTTNQKNVVTWTSIHHKTSLHGGPHGWPDASFLKRCNDTLTALGVPACNEDPPLCNETLHRQAPASWSLKQNLDYCLEDMVPTTTATNNLLFALPPPCAPTVAVPSLIPTALAPAMPSLPPVFAPTHSIKPSAPPQQHQHTMMDNNNNNNNETTFMEVSMSTAPATDTTTKKPTGRDCAICPDTLDPHRPRPCVKIITCQHQFHSDCLHDALNRGKVECPLCRCKLGPQGKSPSGTMDIKLTDYDCAGYFDHNHATKTIQIDYNVPAGQQQSYHDNPSLPFDAVWRVAYLPHTTEGVALLQRIKYAWMHGLCFSVGRSLATGKASAVTWSTDLPHKTSLKGGPFGFPDDNYLDNCNQALDRLGIPPANKC
jgi:deltex-like protein